VVGSREKRNLTLRKNARSRMYLMVAKRRVPNVAVMVNDLIAANTSQKDVTVKSVKKPYAAFKILL